MGLLEDSPLARYRLPRQCSFLILEGSRRFLRVGRRSLLHGVPFGSASESQFLPSASLCRADLAPPVGWEALPIGPALPRDTCPCMPSSLSKVGSPGASTPAHGRIHVHMGGRSAPPAHSGSAWTPHHQQWWCLGVPLPLSELGTRWVPEFRTFQNREGSRMACPTRSILVPAATPAESRQGTTVSTLPRPASGRVRFCH